MKQSELYLLRSITTGGWFMTAQGAAAYVPSIIKMLKGDTAFEVAEPDSKALLKVISRDGNVVEIMSSDSVNEAVTEHESIVIVPFMDAIVKYDMMCGPVGMLTRAAQITEAANNDKVSAIICLFDSPGGEAGAIEIATNAIEKCQKPIIGMVQGLCCSAAMWIGSACDELWISNDTDIVGSIGTMITIANYEKRMKAEGIELHEIYADDSIDKNRGFREAQKGNYTTLKTELLNPLNDLFKAAITKNRPGINQKAALTGRTFVGASAIEQGLVDGKTNLETLITEIMFGSKYKGLDAFTKKVKLSSKDLTAVEKILANAGLKGVKLVAQQPQTVLMETSDEAEPAIYVYAEEGEDLTGKRCVYADEAGAPTEDNVEDGDHPLNDGSSMTTSTHEDGMSYVDSVGSEDEPAEDPAPPAAPASKAKKPVAKVPAKKVTLSAESRAIMAAVKEMMTEQAEATSEMFEELRAEMGSNGDVVRDANTITSERVSKGKTQAEITGKTAIQTKLDAITENKRKRKFNR